MYIFVSDINDNINKYNSIYLSLSIYLSISIYLLILLNFL